MQIFQYIIMNGEMCIPLVLVCVVVVVDVVMGLCEEAVVFFGSGGTGGGPTSGGTLPGKSL